MLGKLFGALRGSARKEDTGGTHPAQDAPAQGADAHEGLADQALAALAAGRLDEAAAVLDGARGGSPRLAQAHFQLAEAYRPRDGLLALHHYKAAVQAHDGHAPAHALLGAMLREQGHVKDAGLHLARALELDAGIAEAAYNLALIRIDQRQWTQAAMLLQQYLLAHPRDSDAHYWRGNALLGDGDAAAARQAFSEAVRHNPDHVQARWAVVMAQLPAIPLSAQEHDEAPANFARTLKALQSWSRTHAASHVLPGARAVGAQQPFYLAYIEQDHREVLARYGALCVEQMSAWARKVGVPAVAPAHGGKLRIGIVSAHIHSHSVWHALLKGWVQHLDRDRFELHIFHTGRQRDAETEWAARHAKLHHGLPDWPAWAKAISDGRFDVLVYPEIGMDAITMRLAALRLARKQVAGWGHPITSGLPTMDAYLSAEAFEPENAQTHYAERELIALPRLGCSYQPYGTRALPADLARWGFAESDRLLVCPGAAFKYRPAGDALLADIARRCAPCKLVFFRTQGDAHGERLEQRLRAAFDAAGVSFDDSVRFLPWQPQAAFFGLLQRAHVVLDTIGFSGFNTIMQAVECGAPVVAWEGRFMRGRFGSGILRQLGLQDWIAATPQDYAEKVQRLCEDPPLREEFRRQLRERSPSLYGDVAGVAALAAHLQRLAAP
jgi:predicted O-linked N-acetylglucosamine transferase (SPINDLY family)